MSFRFVWFEILPLSYQTCVEEHNIILSYIKNKDKWSNKQLNTRLAKRQTQTAAHWFYILLSERENFWLVSTNNTNHFLFFFIHYLLLFNLPRDLLLLVHDVIYTSYLLIYVSQSLSDPAKHTISEVRSFLYVCFTTISPKSLKGQSRNQ
jgi:hypothetical protein